MSSFPSAERSLKTVHSWLGVFILPWIVVIGFTGFYLNHWKLVDGYLKSPAYDESLFDTWPNPQKQDRQDVMALAETLWPDEIAGTSEQITYHGRQAWRTKTDTRTLILDIATGHYWAKTSFTRKTYDPGGTLLHSKIYWGSLFKTLHERGWIDIRFGTWLADITALAMVVFGLSGLFLFTAPRLRRRRNRMKRLRGSHQTSRSAHKV